FKDAPAMPGEEARYAQVLAVVEAANADPKIKAAMTKAAVEADAELIKPVFDFRNFGVQLSHHWSTVRNGAAYGTDYFMRTAIAKSNILVNTAQETTYFYQDLDADGARLNSVNRYIVTFPKGQTPPVDGFWSLTLYNKNHFFEPNPIKRYSLGTKYKSLKLGADGSLTIYVQADSPGQRHSVQLATGTQGWRLFAVCPRLLAEDCNNGWLMDATASAAGELNARKCRHATMSAFGCKADVVAGAMATIRQ
ncbi:MAG: DUF1214 domain-containing protein, partial [Xanthobacteraceae bacterium]